MKNLSTLKTLAISTFAFLCLSSYAQKSVDIKALIPEDADMAAYVQTNEELIKELESQKEYQSIKSELQKKFNKTFELAYQELLSEIDPSQKTLLNAFINPKDIISSIENLALEQNLSLMVCGNKVFSSEESILIALKAKRPLIESAVNVLNSIDGEDGFSKLLIDGKIIFEIGEEDESTFYLAQMEDCFLFSSNKELILSILKGKNTRSILDNSDFNDTIFAKDSDVWMYLGKNFIEDEDDDSPLANFAKAIGIELKIESLNALSSNINIKFDDKKTIDDINAFYPSFKSPSLVEDAPSNTYIFLSILAPKDLSAIWEDLTGMALPISVAREINNVENLDAFMYGDALKLKQKPDFIVNAYTKNPLGLIEGICEKTDTMNGFECGYVAGESLVALQASNSKVSIFLNGQNTIETFSLATSMKSNSEIADALKLVKMDNTIAEAYIDLKALEDTILDFTKDEVNNLTPSPIDINTLLSALVSKNILTAKLGFKKDTLNIALRAEFEYNQNLIDEIVSIALSVIANDEIVEE